MSGITLDETIVERVNGSFESGKYILIAYVDPEGQPKLSYRGSTHVHDDDQLAIWVRDPEGGLLKAMSGENPRITLMYRDPETRMQYSFYGKGRIAEDEESRNRVFNESAEGERNRDPEMKGKALIVDLDIVQGGGPGGRIDLRR